MSIPEAPNRQAIALIGAVPVSTAIVEEQVADPNGSVNGLRRTPPVTLGANVAVGVISIVDAETARKTSKQ